MRWLERAETTDGMFPDDAERYFERKHVEIQEEVLRALFTESVEPASPDGKAEIVIEIKLVKSNLDLVMQVVTNVYAVVYMSHNRRYFVRLNDKKELEKISALGENIFSKLLKKGESIPDPNVVKCCKYILVM
jgi:hypothetical protein